MGVRYGSLPFKEQIAFWRAKELVPTERWNDLVREQHDTAFTGDLEPVFADIGEYLTRSHDERFGRQVAPDGEPWKELSPGYQARKPKNQDKILTLEGDLRRSLHADVSADELLFGTILKYGATHQFGDPRRHIPERPFLGVSDDDRDEILDIIRDHIQAAL
ncbi:phage virion morphogenesis protein [Methylomicrobium album]|uniref:Phage virion morphogenesis protein, putative tail completion n=1 Tax=Methylomicrobium album BG8 TaxID=686340 RepID=H8GJA7_METAL|nr:phage virion morphogenesis protein [Methylomicrobium album]EIC29097.1 phage virion morphogenesis protein, putative tail completion [Methylomicrobium album BG8]